MCRHIIILKVVQNIGRKQVNFDKLAIGKRKLRNTVGPNIAAVITLDKCFFHVNADTIFICGLYMVAAIRAFLKQMAEYWKQEYKGIKKLFFLKQP